MFQFLNTVKCLPRDQFARRLDGLAVFGVAPDAQGIEVLHAQADGIHAGMAGKTQRIFPMDGQRLAQGRLVVLK